MLRIAVVTHHLDPAHAGLRSRALWPLAVWRAAGHDVDLLHASLATPRLARYDAVLLADPRTLEELACAEDAYTRGVAVLVDVASSLLPGPDASFAERQACAVAVHVVRHADAVSTDWEPGELPGLASVRADAVTLPNAGETEADKDDLLRALSSELRAARRRTRTSRIRAFLLSKRGLLALPLRAVHVARGIPLSQWPVRVRRVIAHQISVRLKPGGLATTPPLSRPLELGPRKAARDRVASSAQPTGPAAPRIDRPASAARWNALLAGAIAHTRSRRLEGRPAPVRVFALLALVQDLDLLLPIVERMSADDRFVLKLAITDWLDALSPRVSRELLARSIHPLIVTRQDVIQGIEPDLTRAEAVIAACESNHPAHLVPYRLARKANAHNLPTYTLQHGLENVALTYFEPYPNHDRPVDFASRTILTWGPVDRLPAEVAPSIRARCFAVGSPKLAEAPRMALPLPPREGPVVAVFENLHWERYPDAYRKAFILDMLDVAAKRPRTTFLVKPHHAGQYLAKNRHLLEGAPPNVVLADPASPPWERFTASAIIGWADAVITTPSTVALDAARAGRPVAVTVYGLHLPIYEPLPLLESAEDWLAFVDGVAASPGALAGRLEDFRKRHVLEGDAVGRILERISSDAVRAREGSPKT